MVLEIQRIFVLKNPFKNSKVTVLRFTYSSLGQDSVYSNEMQSTKAKVCLPVTVWWLKFAVICDLTFSFISLSEWIFFKIFKETAKC